jgi:aromatic ring-opening dioxygenase LigB subunit
MIKKNKLIKSMIDVSLLIFYKFRYTFANVGVIHCLAIIDKETGKETPFDFTWGEKYILWIEYLRRRSIGLKCTYNQVEFEYLKDFNDKVDEALKKFNQNRKENPIQ